MDRKYKIFRILHNPAAALILLIGAFLLTATGWFISNRLIRERAEDRFHFRTEDIETAIKRRMLEYEQVLRGGQGLFHVDRFVTRRDWKNYVDALDINKYYPGIQGLGFSLYVPPGQVDSLESVVQADGYADFRIWPDSARDEFHTILYLEPFQGRNLRAFGYDMHSNDIRREAMDRARDTGKPSLSGKVTLVQETGTDVQAGFLLYLPVYKDNMPTRTIEERRKALFGFVYSPFRVNDLMAGILGAPGQNVDFEIFDGNQLKREFLLYDTDDTLHLLNEDHKPYFSSIRTLRIAGQPWTIYFSTDRNFLSSEESSQPLIVAAGGITLDILIFYILVTLTSISRRNKILADRIRVEKERYDLVAAATKDVIWDWNLSNDQVFWNENLYVNFGYSKEEAPKNSKRWRELIHPEDRDKFIRSMDSVIHEGGRNWQESYRFRKKDGQYAVIFDRGHVIRDKYGNAARMVGLMMDVTERVRAEEALRESEERFRFLADSSPMMIWLADEEGKVTWYNQTMREFVGYGDDEVLKNGWEPLVHPDDLERVSRAYIRTIESRMYFEEEFRVRKQDGTYRWVLSAGKPRLLANGEFVGIVGSAIDIHDRKLALEALRTSEASLSLALESADIGTWDYDLINHVVSWDQKCKSILGIEGDGYDIDNFLEIIHPDDRDKAEKAVRDALDYQKQEELNLEYRINNGNGHDSWVMAKGRAFFDDHEKPVRIIGTVIDITERKKALLAEKELMQRKDEFIGIASHELKTPITSLKGYLEIISLYVRDGKSDEIQEFLQKAMRQINKLTELINDLLDVSRIQSGKLQLNIGTFDAGDMVRDAVDQIRHGTKTHSIQLELEQELMIEGDRNRLEQVVNNLLSNAIKYSPDADKVIVSMGKSDGIVRIAVQDFGVGIPKKKIPHVFDRFFRANETAVQFAGIGLGLYISSQIVERHRGRISVESKFGEGSIFTIEIPMVFQDAEEKEMFGAN